MAAVESDWEDIPSYFDLIRGITEFLEKTYRETFIEKKEPHPVELTWHYYNFTANDILLAIILSLAWTVLRYLATKCVFKPLAHYYALTPTNQRKMPESAWKFAFYLSAWCSTCYVVIFSGKYKFFQKPSSVWNDWSLDKPLPSDIYFLYMTQFSFYLHSVYATLFLDTWRKDSFVMMIHHFLTLVLLSFSYSLRYHNIGCLVIFGHDVCDISLEFTKLNVYFKIQGNKKVQKHEILANISFFIFTLTWFVARLYWFPLRVLYTATSDVQRMQLILPCALIMNNLLWLLQLMNIYWFLFIVQFLYRVATGQVREIDDTREYDVEEKILKQLATKNSNHNDVQNGEVKTNGSCLEVPLLNGDIDIVNNRIKSE